jgi:hypothetical protein
VNAANVVNEANNDTNTVVKKVNKVIVKNESIKMDGMDSMAEMALMEKEGNEDVMEKEGKEDIVEHPVFQVVLISTY